MYKSATDRYLLVFALHLLFPGIIVAHLYFAPYTKVEESFNMHAAYDFLRYGIPSGKERKVALESFDHIHFPGAVPRTFAGALVLAELSRPFRGQSDHLELSQQLAVRGVLGGLNALALAYMQQNVRSLYGFGVSVWFLLLQASQFHMMFYASRLLPNMIAFPLTTIAFAVLLPRSRSSRRRTLAACLFTFSAVVIRAELGVLLVLQSAVDILLPTSQALWPISQPRFAAAAASILLTVMLDSYMWQSEQALWPELHSVLFNVVSGKSSQWGTSGPLFYFLSSVPRLLLNPLCIIVLIPRAIYRPELRQKSWPLLTWSLCFLSTISLLPHKEWRFIIYVVPLLTICAALGADSIWSRRQESWRWRCLSLWLCLSVVGTFCLSFGMLVVSSANYPGASAMNVLHAHAAQRGDRSVARVHMDSFSRQTGITRFLEYSSHDASIRHPRLLYDKTEEIEDLRSPQFWEQFTYAIMETPSEALGTWSIIRVIPGFGGLGWMDASQQSTIRTKEQALSIYWIDLLNQPANLLLRLIPGIRMPAIRTKALLYVLESDQVVSTLTHHDDI